MYVSYIKQKESVIQGTWSSHRFQSSIHYAVLHLAISLVPDLGLSKPKFWKSLRDENIRQIDR